MPATSWFDHPDTAATGQIQLWYQQYLHRAATPAEITSQLGNPGGLPAVETLIKSSPEAAAATKAAAKVPTAADAKGYSLGDYTYAGFEPTSLTRHLDTTDVTAGGKDFVQRYLVNNQIDPNSKTWAPAAAAALNKQYGTTVFNAIDGETLGYGDEYVHSAPNGYGLQAGQFDPKAKGQFFWASTTPAAATTPPAAKASGAGAATPSGPAPAAPPSTMADLLSPALNPNMTPALTAPTVLPQQYSRRFNTMAAVM